MTPTRPVLPVLLVVDTSGSMADLTDVLADSVRRASEAAWTEQLVGAELWFGAIEMGGTPRVLLPVSAARAPEDPPVLVAEGPADVAGTVDLLAAEGERGIERAVRAGRSTRAPWVVLLTDGRWATGDAEAAIARLHGPPTEPVVLPIGVGRADETMLARLARPAGLAVDTTADLPDVTASVVRAAARSQRGDGALPVPSGSRPLEGW